MEDIISKLANTAIVNKVFPGCVVGYIKEGKKKVLPFGRFTYESDSAEVVNDTIYDVASITKSIPTSSLALMLIDQGDLKTTDKLIKYVPEFQNSDRENVLIKHLLTYTIDGYGLASLEEKTATKLWEYVMTHDFEKRPGSVFKYSNIPAALLGVAVERILGDTLDNLGEKYFFNPLNMERTTFHPENFPMEEIVPTEIDNWRGLVRGIVHDESAYICRKEGKAVGHAGLFSTAPDILKFLEMLLNKGVMDSKTYFTPEIVTQMGTNQIPELNDYCGLGWELNQPRFMGNACTPHTFGKTGFTGTLCVCDVEKQAAFVILSNRIFPKRPQDSTAINAFRAAIGEIILK